MTLLLVSNVVMDRHALAYVILLVATASLGVGFGLTVPALNTFTAAFHPDTVDTSVLVLNALLGLGTALAPIFVARVRRVGLLVGSPAGRRHRPPVAPRRELAPPARRRVRRGVGPGREQAARRAAAPLLDLRRVRALLRRVRDHERELGVARHEEPRGVDHDGVAGAHHVLGVRDARAGRLRRDPTLVPDPAHLSRPAVRARGRVRRDLGPARQQCRGRDPRVRPRRSRVLRVAPAHDQLRPGGARGHVDGDRRLRHRVLPTRLRDRGVRRGPDPSRRRASSRPCSGARPSSRSPWACWRSSITRRRPAPKSLHPRPAGPSPCRSDRG